LFPLLGLPSHWGGMGRNQLSQWSMRPICISSNSLIWLKQMLQYNLNEWSDILVFTFLPLAYALSVGTVFRKSKRGRGAEETFFGYLKVAFARLYIIFSDFIQYKRLYL
jgi:hypothetical protein